MKEKLSITLDEELVKALRKKASESDRSVSSYINLVLKKHLKKAK